MKVIKDLFSSKKFVVSFAGMLAVIANRLGIGIDDDTILKLVILVAGYVGAQGLADFGKEKAKAEKE